MPVIDFSSRNVTLSRSMNDIILLSLYLLSLSLGSRAVMVSVSNSIPKKVITCVGPTVLCLAIGVHICWQMYRNFCNASWHCCGVVPINRKSSSTFTTCVTPNLCVNIHLMAVETDSKMPILGGGICQNSSNSATQNLSSDTVSDAMAQS